MLGILSSINTLNNTLEAPGWGRMHDEMSTHRIKLYFHLLCDVHIKGNVKQCPHTSNSSCRLLRRRTVSSFICVISRQFSPSGWNVFPWRQSLFTFSSHFTNSFQSSSYLPLLSCQKKEKGQTDWRIRLLSAS